MIAEASLALTELDADALEELGRRANALATLNAGCAGESPIVGEAALRAGAQGLAAALRATGENLAALQAVGERFAGAALGDLGAIPAFFSEETLDPFAWPRTGASKAREARVRGQ